MTSSRARLQSQTSADKSGTKGVAVLAHITFARNTVAFYACELLNQHRLSFRWCVSPKESIHTSL